MRKYTFDDIETILGYTSWNDRRKIDTLLEIDCSLYAHLGTDSTRSEREDVKRKSIEIYRKIKTIDRKLGDEFLLTMNLKQ